jgi:hypothetical protein
VKVFVSETVSGVLIDEFKRNLGGLIQLEFIAREFKGRDSVKRSQCFRLLGTPDEWYGTFHADAESILEGQGACGDGGNVNSAAHGPGKFCHSVCVLVESMVRLGQDEMHMYLGLDVPNPTLGTVIRVDGLPRKDVLLTVCRFVTKVMRIARFIERMHAKRRFLGEVRLEFGSDGRFVVRAIAGA